MSGRKGRLFTRTVSPMPMPVKLSETARNELLDNLGSALDKIGKTKNDADGFLRKVEWIIGEYRSAQYRDDQIAGAARVRAAFDQLLCESMELCGHLYRSDEATGGLLLTVLEQRGAPPEFLKSLRLDLTRLNGALIEARRLADDLPDKTPTPQRSARRTLAVELAKAFRDHLGLTPTTTRGGPFESCLLVLLDEAGGDKRGVDRLALFAIKELNLS